MISLSLAEQFPTLFFARKAQGWLDSIKKRGLNISEQLQERKILEIKVKPLLTYGGIGKMLGGFRIYLNDWNSVDDHVKTLGHEIGHTFHCVVHKLVVVSLFPDRPLVVFEDDVEKFCDTFSDQWLLINEHRAVKEFLNKMRFQTKN